jgi:hypothetical protein
VGRICEEQYPPFFQVDDQKVACWIYEQGVSVGGEKASASAGLDLGRI